MRVLGFDTATLTPSVALVQDGVVLAAARGTGSGRNADLLVTIDDVCKRATVAPASIDAVAVGAGPGSFTGLRIGMATAKGIAFAAQRPLWAVSSLAALAWDAMQPGVVVAVLDARRGEVFAGGYRDGVALADERVLPPADIAAWIGSLTSDPVTFIGDALAAYPHALAPHAPYWISATPSGSAICALAVAGSRSDILTTGAPTYIRPPEAEVMYPDGVPGALRKP